LAFGGIHSRERVIHSPEDHAGEAGAPDQAEPASVTPGAGNDAERTWYGFTEPRQVVSRLR